MAVAGLRGERRRASRHVLGRRDGVRGGAAAAIREVGVPHHCEGCRIRREITGVKPRTGVHRCQCGGRAVLVGHVEGSEAAALGGHREGAEAVVLGLHEGHGAGDGRRRRCLMDQAIVSVGGGVEVSLTRQHLLLQLGVPVVLHIVVRSSRKVRRNDGPP